MRKEELFELIGDIDEKFIKEADIMNLEEKQAGKRRGIKGVAIVAAAVAISIILPNVNGDLALAMEKLPVVGKYFEVVTFREYQYQDSHNQAEVSIPQVTVGDNAADAEKQTAASLNKSIEEYAKEFEEKFQENLKTENEGYQELSMDYQVVTDNTQWLTIKVTALQVEAGGYEQVKYYHIDKTTGKEAVLSDLFLEGSDYIDRISDNIKEQMKANEEKDLSNVYFYEDSLRDNTGLSEDELFQKIQPEQNFYFNEKGELVISFNEYEVAPGAMGVVEFTIPEDVISNIRK